MHSQNINKFLNFTIVIFFTLDGDNNTMDFRMEMHSRMEFQNGSAFQSGILEWKCIPEWNFRMEVHSRVEF